MKWKISEGVLLIFCPGCSIHHRIPLIPSLAPDNKPWKWNEDTVTLHPSVKIDWGGNECCHFNLILGMLVYAADTTHAFARKSVPLPDLPE